MNQRMTTSQVILPPPQILNDRSQQSQHSPCSLESRMITPAQSEHINQLRMERIRLSYLVSIRNIISLSRKIAPTIMIHRLIFSSNGINDIHINNPLKKSPSYHLKN